MTAPAPATASLSWPPPALESIHGRLWPAIAVLALADIVLVPPLLLSLGTHQPIGSLGPFGDAFWVPLATSFLGSILLIAGLWRLARLLRGARTAARAGHARRTILMVLADEPRDSGFLLTGARAYASLGATERDTILAARTLTAGLSLAAVLLAPLGLTLSILLGRLTISGEGFLWPLALWVPLASGAGAVLGAAAARALAASAKRQASGTGAADASLPTAVAEWHAGLIALRPDRASRLVPAARPRAFGLGAAGALLLAVAVVIPVAALVVGGTIGSILASIATPNFSATNVRIAAAAPLRRFVVAPDPSISPDAAGQALHALLSVGQTDAERTAPQRTPVRSYPEPWFHTDPAAPSLRGASWVDSLFGPGSRTAARTAYLRRVAAHPAHAEFTTVARAQTADVIGTRYQLPFGPGVTFVTLPIPRFGGIRLGGRAHLARAALALADGRPAQAEEGIREVISVGFRLLDDGPTLIDNLIGAVLAGMGGDALEAFYRSTGRSADAEALAWVRTEARGAAEYAVAGGRAAFGVEASLRTMPRLVLDSTQAKGLRFEFFGWTSVFAPCANIKALAFGPGVDYAEWLESARAGLVRRPSDEALLELMLKGPFGTGRCVGLWGGLRTIGQMR